MTNDVPTLILPPRYTADSNLLWKAAIDFGWDVERLTSWRVPDGFRPARPVLYGEPLFVEVVAASLGVEMLSPSDDLLVTLPHEFRLREVKAMSIGELARISGRRFIKPMESKSFPVGVYELPGEMCFRQGMPDETMALVSEAVTFEVEYRAFVMARRI